MQKIKINANTTRKYVSVFNFIFRLTDTEIDILAEFIDIYKELSKNSININPFSTEIKKKVAERLGREDFNTLNNYITSLRKKKAIQDDLQGYKINPILIPGNVKLIEI